MVLSTQTLAHNQEFIDQIRAIRTLNSVADQFFKQFFELCQDYEAYARSEMTDDQQYWLMRLGRMLSLMGQDPFPNLTFTHPEEPRIGRGYAS